MLFFSWWFLLSSKGWMERRVSNDSLRCLDVGRAAETLRVRDARECKVFGENVKFLERPIKEIDLLVQCRVTFGRQGIGEIRSWRDRVR